MGRAFTKSTFARRLGFSSASDKKFRALLKLAERKGLVKIQHGGFRSDWKYHPYIVVLMKPFEEIRFIERTVFPSYTLRSGVEGYRLVKQRTGFRRPLKDGLISYNEWWVCEDCGRKINIGKPYAVKVDFAKKTFNAILPIRIKCVSCYLDLIEEVEGWMNYG
jgi:hypothetical protein